MPRSDTVHRVLAVLSRITPRPRRVIVAFHRSPSAEALTRTLDVLRDTVGPFRSVDEVVDGAPGVALTFDDGDRSIVDVAAPVLQGAGAPASAYVVPGLVDTDRPFWWTEVEQRAPHDAARMVPAMKRLPDEARLDVLDGLRARTPEVDATQPNLRSDELPGLEAMGVTVGNHTVTHPLLPRCPTVKVEAEIVEAHERLTAWLGHEPTSIAYPNGDVDDRGLAVCRRLGYRTGLLFDHRPVGDHADPLLVSRVRVDVDHDPATVRARASGLHPRVHHALGRP